MKRSEINSALRWATTLLKESKIYLPRFAYWDMEQWVQNSAQISAIRSVMQGWDVTDFGYDCFREIGAVLFTVRNGMPGNKEVGTPYAEKYLILHEGQHLPMHCHHIKTEDIINRGGGIMTMQFFNSLPDGSVDRDRDVEFLSDGLKMRCHAGASLEITSGNSVTIPPRLYHIIGVKPHNGDLVAGEVSSINDDNSDNYWVEAVSRFSQVEEDEPPLYPLCKEYERWLTQKL